MDKNTSASSRRVLALLALLVAASLIAVTPAAASPGLRIVSPGDGRFFTEAPVGIKVEAAKSVRSLQVTLNGKRTRGAFRRIGPGTWKATLGAKQLVRGRNNLAIWAGGKGGRKRYASVRFDLGKHDRSLLSVSGPGSGMTKVARVRVARTPLRLTAKLNGRRLHWPLGLNPLRKETLRLGSDDGLHFGVNRLRVFAIGAGGVYDTVTRKVRVTRARPLAGAGRDRRIVAGRRVRLDGSSSVPAHGKSATLSYRWKIVRKPPGSKAKLNQSDSVNPVLVTDEPGQYSVQLLVTEPGPEGTSPAPAAADLMTVNKRDSLPPIGEEIETMVSNGKSGAEADSGIKVGEKTYWMGAPQGKTAQVLMLDRETLEPLYVASYANESEAGQLGNELSANGSNALTIISVPNLHGNSPRNVELGLIAADIGAENTVIYPNWEAGWSAIGVDGTKQGGTMGAGGNVNPKPNGANYAGNMSGYLQWASGKGFVYVPGSRVVFETDAPGAATNTNKMVVGGHEYASSPLPSCGVGGFQVQILLAETLAPVEGATFTTHGCTAASEATQQVEMAGYLKSISVNGNGAAGEAGPKLVFVQSIGQPYGPLGHAWNSIAVGIEAVGGVGSAFAIDEKDVFGLGKTGYALVGSVGVSPPRRAEASELWTGDAAKVSGVLKPNQVSAYVPELSSPIGADTYTLSAIAYQAPQAWPDSSSPADEAALRYIAEDVLELEKPEEKNSCYIPPQPDVRSMYCDGQEIGHWRENAGKLERSPFSPGHGFEKPEWEAVVDELAQRRVQDRRSDLDAAREHPEDLRRVEQRRPYRPRSDRRRNRKSDPAAAAGLHRRLVAGTDRQPLLDRVLLQQRGRRDRSADQKHGGPARGDVRVLLVALRTER